MLIYVTPVLKNIPIIEPKEHNEKTQFAYNADIMEKAKTDPVIRGPGFMDPVAVVNGQSAE